MVGKNIIFFTICLVNFVNIATCFLSFKWSNWFGHDAPPLEEDIVLPNDKDTIKYYKYVMLIFCRVADRKLLRNSIQSKYLEELKTYSETKYLLSAPYKVLKGVSLNLLKDYNDAIERQDNDYLHRAFYYRLLKWLMIKIRLKGKSNNSIERFIREIYAKKTAENYIIDTADPSNADLIINVESDDLNSVLTLENFGNEEDRAMYFCSKIAFSSDEFVQNAAKNDQIFCQDYDVYQRILKLVDPQLFSEKFGTHPSMMLWFVEYVLDSKRRHNGEEIVDRRSAALLPDVGIDLKNFTPKTIQYYKYVMVIFCRILSWKLFDDQAPASAALFQLENMSSNSLQMGRKCYEILEEIFKHILADYREAIHIPEEDYSSKMFYRGALIWFDYKLKPEDWPTKELKNFLEQKRKKYKPEMALTEIMSEEQADKILDFEYDKLNTIEALKRNNFMIEHALRYCYQIGKTHGQSIEQEEMICTDRDLYETILSEADENLIQEKFKITPAEMLCYVENALYLEEEKHTDTPKRDEKTGDEIHLLAYKKGSIEYYKRVITMFFRAVEKNVLEGHFVPSENLIILETFPVHDKHFRLRYCALKNLCYFTLNDYNSVIETFETNFPKTKKFFTKAFYNRVLKWLRIHVSHRDIECKMAGGKTLEEEIDRIRSLPAAENILTRLAPEGEEDFVIDIPQNIYTVDTLLYLGGEEDFAVESLYDFAAANTKEGETVPEWKNPLLLKYEVYSKLLPRLDREKFRKEFGKDPTVMLDEIKVAVQILKERVKKGTEELNTIHPPGLLTKKYAADEVFTQQSPPTEGETINENDRRYQNSKKKESWLSALMASIWPYIVENPLQWVKQSLPMININIL